jgi:TRAP-type C4-dicarboxylate transport system permease small subunit
MNILKSSDRVIGRILRWGSVSLLFAIFILLSINVLIRFFPIISFEWFDEIVEMLIAWMVFLGTAALWRENEHFAITFLPEALKGKKTGSALDILINLISLVFFGVFTYYSLNLTLRVTDWTPTLNMPKSLLYASMPVSGILMVIYSFRNILSGNSKNELI